MFINRGPQKVLYNFIAFQMILVQKHKQIMANVVKSTPCPYTAVRRHYKRWISQGNPFESKNFMDSSRYCMVRNSFASRSKLQERGNSLYHLLVNPRKRKKDMNFSTWFYLFPTKLSCDHQECVHLSVFSELLCIFGTFDKNISK